MKRVFFVGIMVLPLLTSISIKAQQSSISETNINDRPRVFIKQVESAGNQWKAVRDQAMEMSKDFENNCPGVRITLNQARADYTVLLNHIEMGLVIRDNQFQVANKDGDLITQTKEGGSINEGVKKACASILTDWAGNSVTASGPAPKGFETLFAVLSTEQSGDKCQIIVGTSTKTFKATQTDLGCQNLPTPHSAVWGKITNDTLDLVYKVSKGQVDSESYNIVPETSGKGK